MTLTTIKQLVVVFAATAIAYLLLAKEPSAYHSDHTRHGACAQIGVRNHSGVEPYDPFGFCSSRDDDAGRDLSGKGR